MLPLRFSINTQLWDPIYNYVDLGVWITFLIDLFVNMRTTFIDSFNREELNSKKIACSYIRSMRFAIDFLALLNLPTIFIRGDLLTRQKSVLTGLGLLRLAKISRLRDSIA